MNDIYVGITDTDWYNFLCAHENSLNGYVNFWTPGIATFKAVEENDYFLFKLHNKKGTNEKGEIVGGGKFCRYEVLSFEQAWEKYGISNGCISIEEMKDKIIKYRRNNSMDDTSNLIGNIVIKDPFFFKKFDWIDSPSDWSKNIVKGKKYSIGEEIGKNLYISLLNRISDINEDTYIGEIEKDYPSIEGKEKEILVKARVNHEVFKGRLLRKCSKCFLCNIRNKNLLIASHIKPWSASNGKEKIDVNNGLLLCPNHDALFDKGFISFDEDGLIMLSDELDKTDMIAMNIDKNMKIDLYDEMKKYMSYHRDNVFKSNKRK